MKVCIRAHDLGVKGTEGILEKLDALDLDGVQLVCYKSYADIPYDRGGITAERAKEIGAAFAKAGKCIPYLGAYFNPVHSDREKAKRCEDVFAEYLTCAKAFGCNVVGSETGSFNDDKWTYHPRNRTPEALETVIDTFGRLSRVAERSGVKVAMEGAAGHVCWNPQTLDKAQRAIGLQNLLVVFDLYNYLDETNAQNYMAILEEGLELFRGRILLFHMKDCLIREGEKPQQVPFGTGDLDIPAILQKIKAYDEDAVLVLEGTTGEYIGPAVRLIRDIWERT